MTLTIYVIDTSALIDMKLHTPIDVYPTQWKMMENLIKCERLKAPIEVFEEIEEKDDELYAWVKKNRNMFIEITSGQIEAVKEIMELFPSLVDESRKHSADPWVIALAIDMRKQMGLTEEREIIVVTNERLRGNKIKIPFVCIHFNVPYISLIDMLRAEGWKF